MKHKLNGGTIMKIKDFFQIGANGLQYLISFSQVEDIARIIGLGFSILISILILVDKIITWWKNAKKDGKITEDEIKDGIDIVQNGLEDIKDHLDDKKKGE